MRVKNVALFFILLFASFAGAQDLPRPRLIDREYRKEYRETIKEQEEQVQEVQENWDYGLPLNERVPTAVYDGPAAADFSNWGKTLLLPAALENRIYTECTYRVVLKVVDTGDSDHPDCQEGKLTAANYTTETTAKDGNGHSTHVWGIAIGKTGGLAYQMVRSNKLSGKAIKVLGTQGQGSWPWLDNALTTEYNDDKVLRAGGVRVVYNMSLGGSPKQPAIESVISAGVNAGNFYIAAAGNSGGPVQFPGSASGSLAVSAYQQNNTLASFSCRGKEIVLGAPGVGIRAPYKNGTWADLSGTSMAAPFVAATTCIAIGKWGPLIPDQSVLIKYFSWIATDLGTPGRDDLYGWGTVFIQRILDSSPAAMPGGPTPPPPPPPAPPVTTQRYHTVQGGYLFRWNKPGQTEYKILTIREIEFTATAKAESGEQGYAIVLDGVKNYYAKWATELTPEMDYRDAAHWAGQFLEYITRDEGTPVQVIRIVASDEAGRIVIATGFDRAEQRSEQGRKPGDEIIFDGVRLHKSGVQGTETGEVILEDGSSILRGVWPQSGIITFEPVYYPAEPIRAVYPILTMPTHDGTKIVYPIDYIHGDVSQTIPAKLE